MDSRSILNPKLLARYSKAESIGCGVDSTNDWDDNLLLNLGHIDVKIIHGCSDELAVKILELGLSSLTSNVSTYSVGALIVGAWGLFSCNESEPCYAFTYPAMSVSPKSLLVDTLDESIRRTAENPAPVSLSNLKNVGVDRFRRSASYLCAAALRMIVKDHRNLLKSWRKIQRQYKKFYKEEIAISLVLDRECVRMVGELLKKRTILKNTVGVFLLAHQDLDEEDKELCKMLYEVHLSYTGMHAYTLLKDCAAMLNTPLYNLIELLDYPRTREGIKCAVHVLETYEMPKTEEAKKKACAGTTWKYARIFNERAFAHLYAKNCSALSGILASIGEQVGGLDCQDAAKIRQIADLGSFFLDKCEEKAKEVIEQCVNANAAECVEKKLEDLGL